MGRIGGGELLILLLVSLIWIWPAARIARKAGFSPAWALVTLVPCLNVVMIWVFALVDWPVSPRPR